MRAVRVFAESVCLVLGGARRAGGRLRGSEQRAARPGADPRGGCDWGRPGANPGDRSDRAHFALDAQLLDAGAKVNVRDTRGYSPLMYAAGSDTLPAAVIKLLLDKGADPSIKDNSGSTALDEALRYRQGKVVSLLMEKTGASAGNIAVRQLQDAVLRGQSDMVILLLDRGADANSRSFG